MHADTVEQALASAAACIVNWRSEGEVSDGWTTAVFVPTGQLRDVMRDKLSEQKYQVDVVDGHHADSTSPNVIYLSTMHRAKGLEFDQVLVLASRDTLGAVAETADSRRLAYVAITRAKRRAAVVWMP